MITVKKKTHLSLYEKVKCETRQFCLNTALHAYKYIAEENSSVFARFTWTFIIFLSVILSIFLLFSSWQYNSQNPIETVADSVHHPIWNYQFPAITICNLNKISLEKATRFVKNIKNTINFDNEYIIKLISFLVKILNLEFSSTNAVYYDDLQKLMDANNFTVQEIMMSVRPDCTELLRSCALKGRSSRCNSLFEETTTPEGLCCSSNYYVLKNLSLPKYMPDRYKKKPRRMSACGYQSGYKILINNRPEDYLLSEMPGYGVKILIHDSYDFPGWASSREILGLMEETFISVTPELTYATEDLQSVKIEDRNCLFTWEKPLEYFRNYSHVNCLTECRINLIKEKCGCVPLLFWNLNSPEFNQSNIYACNIKTAPCVDSLSDTLVTFLPGFKYNGTKAFDYKFAENQSYCKCLPNCESRVYHIETSKTIFSRKHAVNNNHFFNGIESKNHSLVTVYFKDLISSRYRKDINISWYSELAWFGGLLGLCLGFSFTSGFEILYYLTIRFFINYFYRKKPQTKVFPVYHIEDHYIRPVPSLHELYNLKKTNNYWYID